MTSKKKNSVNEPEEVYDTSPKVESTLEEPHPILVKLIEKSIQNHSEGKVLTHEEAMKRIKERYPFLK